MKGALCQTARLSLRDRRSAV